MNDGPAIIRRRSGAGKRTLPQIGRKTEGQSCGSGSGGAVHARLRLFAHEIEELLNRCIELPSQRQSQ
jgi:hypothetical protein